MWLCDLACFVHTGKTLPALAMVRIWQFTEKLNRHRRHNTQDTVAMEESIVVKGARKAKWTKHVLTKYRMKQAFRYR